MEYHVRQELEYQVFVVMIHQQMPCNFFAVLHQMGVLFFDLHLVLTKQLVRLITSNILRLLENVLLSVVLHQDQFAEIEQQKQEKNVMMVMLLVMMVVVVLVLVNFKDVAQQIADGVFLVDELLVHLIVIVYHYVEIVL
jgi:hypothetical protein